MTSPEARFDAEPIYADEGLLDDIPSGVVEVLGKDNVLDIEHACERIGAVDRLASQPNPFRSPGEADLSFLKPRQLTQIEDLKVLKGPYKQVFEHLSQRFKGSHPLTRVLLAGRLEKIQRAAYKYSRKAIKGTSSNLEDCSEGVKDFITNYEEGEGRLDLTVAEQHISHIAGIAYSLPSAATLEAVKDIHRGGRALNELQARGNPLVVGSLGMYQRSIAELIDTSTEEVVKVSQLVKYRQEVSDWGQAIYEGLKFILNKEEARYAKALVDRISQSRDVLEQEPQLEDARIEDLLAAEQYLIDKIFYARAALRKADPNTLNDTAIRDNIRRLGSGALANVLEARRKGEQLRIHQEMRERSRGFSSQVSETRDVLLGGRRLSDGKRQSEIAAKADALRDSFTEERNELGELEPVGRGIIMAIIFDKFADFVDTTQRVQRAGKDEIVDEVEHSRPSLVKTLKEFPLIFHMTQVKNSLDEFQTRFILQEREEVLTADELTKVRTTLTEFLLDEEVTEREQAA